MAFGKSLVVVGEKTESAVVVLGIGAYRSRGSCRACGGQILVCGHLRVVSLQLSVELGLAVGPHPESRGGQSYDQSKQSFHNI